MDMPKITTTIGRTTRPPMASAQRMCQTNGTCTHPTYTTKTRSSYICSLGMNCPFVLLLVAP